MWNCPEIGIEWSELFGDYCETAASDVNALRDGTTLILSDKDKKWLGLYETLK